MEEIGGGGGCAGGGGGGGSEGAFVRVRRPVRPPGSFLAADFRICGSFTLFQGNLLPM